MQIIITYAELQKVATERFNKSINLSYVNNDTCTANIEVTIPFLGQTIPVTQNLKIAKVESNDICLSLGNDTTQNMAISIALPMIQKKIGKDFIEKTEDNLLVVHLEKNEKTKRFFENMVLEGIYFTQDAINLIVNFKKK